MGSISPVNREPRECAALRRNIRRFARERADERAKADRARAEVERRRGEWEAARRRLFILKQRAKAQARRSGRGGGSNREENRRDEQIQHGAELLQRLAEALLGDYSARAREAEQLYREAQKRHQDAEHRWREADRALLLQDQRFAQFGCRGSAMDHHYPAD